MQPDSRSWLRDRRPRGYLRVSSQVQADKYGPAAQRHDENAAVAQFGLADLHEFYEDHVSGREAIVRSDFQRMVADARLNKFDVLLVGRVDRFARNERDAWNYLHRLEEAGVAVYFCEEDVLVPHDDGWQDRIGAEVNAAAAYSRKLSRNVKKGLARKWAAGGHVGGVPWGYQRTEDKLGIEPDPATAPLRALTFELYATGNYTFSTLADEMNSRGIRIAALGKQARPFTKFTVSDVLSNPVVIGTVTWRAKAVGGEERAGVAPIISAETWQRVQEITVARHGNREHFAIVRHRYLFTPVVRCADCGEAYWGRTTTRRKGTQSYAQLRHAPRGCTTGVRSRNELRLTEQFGTWLSAWTLPADARARLSRYMNAGQVDAAKVTRRRQLAGELDRLINLYRWGDLAEADYLAERRRVNRAVEALGPDERTSAVNEDALRLAETVGTAWQFASMQTRRAFLTEWFSEVRLRTDGGLEIVPREAVREVVYAAAPSGTEWGGPVGSTGLDGYGTTPQVRLIGIENWSARWEATA